MSDKIQFFDIDGKEVLEFTSLVSDIHFNNTTKRGTHVETLPELNLTDKPTNVAYTTPKMPPAPYDTMEMSLDKRLKWIKCGYWLPLSDEELSQLDEDTQQYLTECKYSNK